ncbi:MAG TPA: hypothetical protein VKU37_08905 [Verrucomicrobiae bacterium]|nr:hypothetical protein [Verrucomicrobiae bacterium]
MNLIDNPIFLTQKRLTHRAGVLAAALIAGLIGLSLLSGLIAYLAAPRDFDFHSPQEAGKLFYGWIIAVEILVLVIGGFSKISRVLADDRKAGLWDSNRLTPLKPAEIVAGYWFGSALREFYMGAVLAGIGLVIVVLANLPVTLWLGTQALILGTTLFFGLLALLAGMVLQRPNSGILLLLPLFFLQMFSFDFPRFTIINFLLPIYGIANLFQGPTSSGNDYTFRTWHSWPEIFALPVPPIVLSLGLQFLVGIFFWRATVRRTANPFKPLLLRWEAIAIFALLVVVQQSLVWGIWQGRFGNPLAADSHSRDAYDYEPMLSIVQGGTILVGMLILALASPLPERVRVEALRSGLGNLRLVFSRSAAWLAVALSGIAAAASATQFIFSFKAHGTAWALAAGNLFLFFLMFSLLLEFCRLRFKRRALSFVVLWLFVLCILPFILAGVFSNAALAKLSFLAPGTIALAGSDSDDLKYLAACTLAQTGVVVLLFIAWQRQWKLLLAPTAPGPPGKQVQN